MNTYYDSRSSRPAGLFSFSLLDSLSGCLYRLHLREAPAGVGLSRLATAFMNNPGYDMWPALCYGMQHCIHYWSIGRSGRRYRCEA